MKDTIDAPTGTDPVTIDRPLTARDFQAFVEPHWSVMARFARRAALDGTWEDVLQDALTTAWRKRRQYDAAKGSSRSWLLSIVADQAYKRRRRSAAPTVALPDLGVADDRTADLDVRQALSQLAPRQRIAVTLRYYLALSTDETAQVMNCSPGTVKSTLSDAKAQLRTLLGKDYDHA